MDQIQTKNSELANQLTAALVETKSTTLENHLLV
jgi:hypothetical protein